MIVFVMYDIPGSKGDEDRDRKAFRDALKDMRFDHVQRSVYWAECDKEDFHSIAEKVYSRAQEIYNDNITEHERSGNVFDIVVSGVEDCYWRREKT